MPRQPGVLPPRRSRPPTLEEALTALEAAADLLTEIFSMWSDGMPMAIRVRARRVEGRLTRLLIRARRR